jgi:hypothetical protein
MSHAKAAKLAKDQIDYDYEEDDEDDLTVHGPNAC